LIVTALVGVYCDVSSIRQGCENNEYANQDLMKRIVEKGRYWVQIESDGTLSECGKEVSTMTDDEIVIEEECHDYKYQRQPNNSWRMVHPNLGFDNLYSSGVDDEIIVNVECIDFYIDHDSDSDSEKDSDSDSENDSDSDSESDSDSDEDHEGRQFLYVKREVITDYETCMVIKENADEMFGDLIDCERIAEICTAALSEESSSSSDDSDQSAI